MEHWEFLLQKEGDRSWFPIKSPRIDIEAGRYRVVVHSNRINADVEICVTHLSTEEVPPKRRSQKRSRRTNPEGLMVVIPFTYLKPGLWELRCSGDILSDFLGDSWQQAVQLQVLSKDAEVLPINEPTVPTEGAVQTGVESGLHENTLSRCHQNDSRGKTPMSNLGEDTENPLVSALQASECIEADSSDAIEAVEPTLVEIESPPLTSVVTNTMEPTERNGDLKIALEDRESGQDGELEKAQSNSGVDQQSNHLFKEESPVVQLDHEAPHPEEEVFDSKMEDWNSPHGLQTQSSQSSSKEESPPRLEQMTGESPLSEGRESLTKSVDEAELVPINSVEPLVSLPPAESDETLASLTSHSAEVATPINPILDQSLQMLEQILQQVLEPVMQEFEQPEILDLQTPATLEPELPLETEPSQPGLLLTLDEETLVSQRGEALTISGQVDALNIKQLNGDKTVSTSNLIFHGTLRYQLRDPQTSQILLDVQQPLLEQALPLSFSHTLEIPPDCQTRLFLGKATLYGSTPGVLASQPFTVTADLDELLGAIIPGTKVMPVAKMLVRTNDLAASPENSEAEPPETVSPPLSQAFVDLVNSPQSRQPLSLQPISRQVLPPQIYQPSPDRKASKSLQLPKLPNIRSITPVDSLAAMTFKEVEVQSEDQLEQWPPSELATGSQPLALVEDLSLSTLEPVDTIKDTALKSESQEVVVSELKDVTLQEATDSVTDFSAAVLDATELSDSSGLIADSEWSNQEAIHSEIAELHSASLPHEIQENSKSIADAQEGTLEETNAIDSIASAEDFLLSDWEATEWLDPSKLDMLSVELERDQAATEDPIVDNAFHALKLHDRFWLRLNSLAADAQLSESLSFEPNPQATDEVESPPVLNPDSVILDGAGIAQQPNSEVPVTDFDESLWAEETEKFDSTSDELAEQQLLPLEDVTMPAQQGLVSNASTTNWAAQEIVVEDDEELLAPEASVNQQNVSGRIYPSRSIDLQPKPTLSSPRRLELPLPAPTLSIPTRELSAGEPVTVRAKVPPHSARLCIKLWIQDRQSRSLLDGPRWLVDLIPDGTGNLEAMTQLIVPFGSAEIRLEAIAVDLDSQRESHKVAVDCIVVPPDLQDLALQEFED